MYQIILHCIYIVFLILWGSFGIFMFYTAVRDDRRREKERKENPDKKYYY